MRNTSAPAPICDVHDLLGRPVREECARLMPRGIQQQLVFLLEHHGDDRIVAALLNSRPRTIRRHARGSALFPPNQALRRRLPEAVLNAVCPVRIAQAAEHAARRRKRRRPAQDE
ncbi:hypothetical protein [Streptomyces sp. NPDC093111]|uniref:hypothetical protein n=1 Tax=Streptomyces sp. NPDC093111 TaxID=3154978 RepID=UPI003442541B